MEGGIRVQLMVENSAVRSLWQAKLIISERFFSIWRSNHIDGRNDRLMLLSHQQLLTEGWRNAGSAQ